MNALSEFNQQSSKISQRCCLAHSLGQTVPEDCTTVAKATFVIVYKYVAREWQAYFQNYANCKK